MLVTHNTPRGAGRRSRPALRDGRIVGEEIVNANPVDPDDIVW